MQSKLFNDFIKAISTLTPLQANTLDKKLLMARTDESSTRIGPCCRGASSDTPGKGESVDLLTTLEARFSERPKCPYCQSQVAIRWGIREGRQRYRCKPCGATFSSLTGTPFSGLRHADKWGEYLKGMTHSLTLRPAAIACGIDLQTSFRWRHRFLSLFCSEQAEELSGIVELDETFLRESFKGKREGLPRPARKRGNDRTPCKKIPVLVARDREQHTVDGLLDNESARELCKHLNGRIRIEATVCADAHLAHEKLADLLGFEFKELVTSAGERVKEGIYHIQHVNAYHSHLKRWLGGVFHGVATKYLPNYLGWRRKLTESDALTTAGLVEKIAGRLFDQPSTAT